MWLATAASWALWLMRSRGLCLRQSLCIPAGTRWSVSHRLAITPLDVAAAFRDPPPVGANSFAQDHPNPCRCELICSRFSARRNSPQTPTEWSSSHQTVHQCREGVGLNASRKEQRTQKLPLVRSPWLRAYVQSQGQYSARGAPGRPRGVRAGNGSAARRRGIFGCRTFDCCAGSSDELELAHQVISGDQARRLRAPRIVHVWQAGGTRSPRLYPLAADLYFQGFRACGMRTGAEL